MGKVIRGYWDCPSCGQKGIDGLLDACPNCGSGKDKNVHYYMKSASDTVTEEELEKARIKKEELDGQHKDWLCSYCGYLNRFSDQICRQCGAPKEEKAQDYGDNFVSQAKEEAKKEELYQEQAQAVLQGGMTRRGPSRTLPLLILSLVLLFVLFFPLGKTLEVTGFSWERQIELESLQEVEESGFSLPAGATLKSTREELSHYNQVLDHYESQYVTKTRRVIDHYEEVKSYRDNGNGTFTEQVEKKPVYATEEYKELEQVPIYSSVPVYRTRYYYTVERWVAGQVLKAWGEDHEPYWPTDYTLRKNQRDTRRSQSYVTYLSDGSSLKESYETWEKRKLGDEVGIKRSLAGIRYGG